MPLDLCHPEAPHEKLRLPNWFVSSLMMDQALDAILRRVKKIDLMDYGWRSYCNGRFSIPIAA